MMIPVLEMLALDHVDKSTLAMVLCYQLPLALNSRELRNDGIGRMMMSVLEMLALDQTHELTRAMVLSHGRSLALKS